MQLSQVSPEWQRDKEMFSVKTDMYLTSVIFYIYFSITGPSSQVSLMKNDIYYLYITRYYIIIY